MNVSDTELVTSILKTSGYELTENENQADIALLNTCSVRENAEQRVFNRVHIIKRNAKKQGKNLIIGILGCIVSNKKEQLLKDLPIDLIVGPDRYKKLPGILDLIILKNNISKKKRSAFDLSGFETYSDIVPTRKGGVSAWVAITRGCNNFCSYCIVPYTRGRERSMPFDNVIDEVKHLVVDGYKEVTLLGQNVNSYKYEGYGFVDLLRKVSDVDGLKRIRFMSPHPKDFPIELIKLMAERDNICNHIHLPLQSGNSRVLKMMNRTYTKESYLGLVDTIKKNIPDIVLTTDIIIGFPTETEEEYLDTVDVVKKVVYDSAFIFKYSPRPHTKATKDYKDDVSDKDKKDRIVNLNKIQDEISLENNKSLLGTKLEVLVEKKGTKKSKTDFQARTCGSKLVVINEKDCVVGDIMDVTVTDYTINVLMAK